MTVDDRTRLNLHRKLETVLGSEEADTLMAHLPPVTWNEVTTKDDLAQTAAMLRNDLRSEMHAIRSELRTEMQVMASELRTEMHTMGSELRTEMRVGVADIRTEMAHLRADVVEGSNRHIKWLAAFAAAWSTLLVTAVRLMP